MIHKIRNIEFEHDNMLINIDGKDYSFPIRRISSKLQSASDIQRNTYEVSPSGYGIHWPLIDEDLSIDGLLKMKRSIPAKGRKRVN